MLIEPPPAAAHVVEQDRGAEKSATEEAILLTQPESYLVDLKN